MKVYFVIAATLVISVSNCAIAQVETQGALTLKQLREQKMQTLQELQKQTREKTIRRKQEQSQQAQPKLQWQSTQSPEQGKAPAQSQTPTPSKWQTQAQSQTQAQTQAQSQWFTPKQQRPIISLDDPIQHKLNSPAAGATFTAGQSLQIEPIVQSPRGTKSVLVKYYLQGSGSTRLVLCQGWDWCGTGRRRGGPSDGVLNLQCYADGDHDEIKPGSYLLVVTQGEHRSSFGSERIIATSDRFTIQANPNARPVSQQPTSSLHGPMGKKYHRSGRLFDRLKDNNQEIGFD